MSTDPSVDFSVTAEELITEAYELIGVLGEGEAPTADQISRGMRSLNLIIKSLQASPGINLFAIQKVGVILTENRGEYTLDRNTDTIFFTGDIKTSSVAVTSDDFPIPSPVDEAGQSLFSSADKLQDLFGGFPFQNNPENRPKLLLPLESGRYQFVIPSVYYNIYTGSINSFEPSGEVLEEDLEEGGTIYYVDSPADRPLRILEAYVRRLGDTRDQEVTLISRQEYSRLSDKTSTGYPTQIYYDPQASAGNLYVWPVPPEGQLYALYMNVQRSLLDVDLQTDEVSFPQEWFNYLSISLALKLGTKYGIPVQDWNKLRLQHDAEWGRVSYFDFESGTSLFLEADRN